MQQFLFVVALMSLNGSTQLNPGRSSQAMQVQQMSTVSTLMIQQQIQFACPMENRADGTTKVISPTTCLSRLQKTKQVLSGQSSSNPAIAAIDEFIKFHHLQ